MATGEGDGKQKTRWGGVILRRIFGRGVRDGAGVWGVRGMWWAGGRRRGSERLGSACPRSSRTSPDGEDAGRKPPPSASVCRRGTCGSRRPLGGGGGKHAVKIGRQLQSAMLRLSAQSYYFKSLGVFCVFKESPFSILLLDQISSDQQCKKLFIILVVALRAAFEVGSYISQQSSQYFGRHFGRLL